MQSKFRIFIKYYYNSVEDLNLEEEIEDLREINKNYLEQNKGQNKNCEIF